MTQFAHVSAAVVYALAGVLGARALGRGAEPRSAVALLLGLGAAIHAGGFVALHSAVPAVPLESFPAALSLIGWLVAASYLSSFRVSRVRFASAWVAGAASIFTTVATIGLYGAQAQPPVPASGAWSHAHVLVSTLGFSLLVLNSLAGTAYLTKQGALKRKKLIRVALPSLESLDRIEQWTLNIGFLLLTLGVATGFAWAARRGSSPWTSHSAWLIAAWAVYLVPICMRIVSGQHGERPARFGVGGFAFLAFSYIGVRVLGIQP